MLLQSSGNFSTFIHQILAKSNKLTRGQSMRASEYLALLRIKPTSTRKKDQRLKAVVDPGGIASDPVKIRHKKMATEGGCIDFMFLGPLPYLAAGYATGKAIMSYSFCQKVLPFFVHMTDIFPILDNSKSYYNWCRKLLESPVIGWRI